MTFRIQIILTVALALLIGGTGHSADTPVDTPAAQSLQKLNGREDQIRRLNLDQELNQFQRRLDEKKRQPVIDVQPGRKFELERLQRQLDDVRIDERLKEVQKTIRLDQVNREQNLSRREQGIRQLQQQGQIEFIQDQRRKLESGHNLDLDRLRTYQPFK